MFHCRAVVETLAQAGVFAFRSLDGGVAARALFGALE